MFKAICRIPLFWFARDATPELTPTRRVVVGGCLTADASRRHEIVIAATAAPTANHANNSGRDPARIIYDFLFIGGSSIISTQKPAGLRFEPLLMTVIFMIIS
jgi:hypothetical protein